MSATNKTLRPAMTTDMVTGERPFGKLASALRRAAPALLLGFGMAITRGVSMNGVALAGTRTTRRRKETTRS